MKKAEKIAKQKTALRQAAFREKQTDRGFVRLTGAWIHPDDKDEVRALIAKLNMARA